MCSEMAIFRTMQIRAMMTYTITNSPFFLMTKTSFDECVEQLELAHIAGARFFFFFIYVFIWQCWV